MEFVLVTPLVVLLAVAVVQVVLVLHVRATLVSAAAEGARAAALAGADPAAGSRRVHQLVDDVLTPGTVRSVSVRRDRADGLSVLAVRLDAEVALVGLLPAIPLTVEGRALAEEVPR